MVENLARAHHQYTPLSGVYISAQEIYTPPPLRGVYFCKRNIHPCHFPIPTCSLLLPTEDARCVNNGNAFQHLRIGARALEPENLKSRIWPAEDIENLKSRIWPAEDVLAQMMTGICDLPVQEGISKLAQRPELLLGVHLVLIVIQSSEFFDTPNSKLTTRALPGTMPSVSACITEMNLIRDWLTGQWWDLKTSPICCWLRSYSDAREVLECDGWNHSCY